MAWVKVPDAHRPLFAAALPTDTRVVTVPMFGGVAAKVNGHIFGGLFGRSAIVRLAPADEPEALALDGAGWFEPMGDGRVSKTSIMLPESVMDEPGELQRWLRRAFDHAVTLPAKQPTKKPVTKQTKPPTKKPVTKQTKQPTKKPVTKQTKQPTKKPAKKRAR